MQLAPLAIGAAGKSAAFGGLGTALQIGGMVLGGISSLTTASANQQLASQQAAEERRLSDLRARRTIGAQRSGFTSSGVTLEGTPLLVIEETARLADLEQQGISSTESLRRSQAMSQGIGGALGAAGGVGSLLMRNRDS